MTSLAAAKAVKGTQNVRDNPAAKREQDRPNRVFELETAHQGVAVSTPPSQTRQARRRSVQDTPWPLHAANLAILLLSLFIMLAAVWFLRDAWVIAHGLMEAP